MSTRSSRERNQQPDSLDMRQQEFNRSKHFSTHQPKQEEVYKNFYKQQLDEILLQKNQYRSLEKQRQQEQRRMYNERLRQGQEAQKVKELSYKNYYQMIMNNQQSIKNKYVNPFEQSDLEKEKLIHRGVELGRVKSQLEYQREVNRQQSVKKEFQTVLSQQLNQKELYLKNQHQKQYQINHHLKNILLTPHEVDRLERERKMNDMIKYKEDLDKFKTEKYNLSHSQLHNPQLSPNNPGHLNQDRHNILLNPVPFNIQNPYILKQMQRKSMLFPNGNSQGLPDVNPYPSTKRNIFG